MVDFEGRVNAMDSTRVADYDPYCLSRAYLEFTGRYGIEISADAYSMVVSCRHPNEPGITLVFPEVSDYSNYQLTFEVIANLIASGRKVHLSRFTKSQADAFANAWRTSQRTLTFEFKLIEETRLDWTYPVHILSTSAVRTRSGARLAQLRQRLHKLDRARLEVEPLAVTRHADEIDDLALRWAGASTRENFSQADLIGPARALLRLMRDHPRTLAGLTVRIDGQLESYCVWERCPSSTLANELVIASNNTIAGLSEWQVVLMCEELEYSGVSLVNLGGSESHGLDRFKRKFSPVMSIPLFTLEANIL